MSPRWGHLFASASLALMTACMQTATLRPATQAERWEPIEPDKNPEVFWAQRTVYDRDGWGNVVQHHALFACYRLPQPGHPTCFLARVQGEQSELKWPAPQRQQSRPPSPPPSTNPSSPPSGWDRYE